MLIILNISVWGDRGSITWLDTPLGVLFSSVLGSRFLDCAAKIGYGPPIWKLTFNSSVQCDTRELVYAVVMSVIDMYNMQLPLLYTFLQCTYWSVVLFLVNMLLSFYPYVNLRVCFQYSSFDKQRSIWFVHSTSSNLPFCYIPHMCMIFWVCICSTQCGSQGA